MPLEDPFAFLGTDSVKRKSIKRAHWRDKLFSKDKDIEHSADNQVEAFLGLARSSTTLPYPASAVKSLHDTSLHTQPPQQSSLQGVSSVSSAPRSAFRKHNARRALRVTFTGQAPEIIGEGGDDADAPTDEISRHRIQGNAGTSTVYPVDTLATQPMRQAQPMFDTSPGHRPYQLDEAKEVSNVPDQLDWKPSLMHTAQEAELLLSLNAGGRRCRLSLRSSPGSNTLARQVRAKMQAEEGRALQRYHEELQSPSPPSPSSLPLAATSQQHPSDVASLRIHDSLYESLPASSSGVPVYSAYRPQANSAVRTLANLSSSELNPSSSLISGSKSLKISPQKAAPVSVQFAPRSKSLSPMRRSEEQSRCYVKISQGSIVNQVSDTDFNDFKAYIAPYMSLISLSAESTRPLTAVTLVEWTKAALWWLLSGKKSLEVYARTRSHSPENMQQFPLASAKQAVIDLGKALWINENIVPQHEEITRYGEMAIDALLSFVNASGDKKMVDILTLHRALGHHIRGLAMSMKRNNILGAIEQGTGFTDRVDTSIWIQYPPFANDVSAVLSGAATRSILMDQAFNGPSLPLMMPLGDTARYFTYGSMFVQVCVSSTEDDIHQFPMPCLLSIVRDRADWYVYAAISSQSELVNVMIQSDKKQGPTWNEVDWIVRSHSMRVKLPRGFELNVIFQEDDFKIIWNIVKYTLNAEASLSPEAGECMVFESTLKIFHYTDPGKPKAFPPEPLERCRVRLFERTVSLTEGTGTRNVHRGFRLTVLTSPRVKTLSNVVHILGHRTPIVFGLLRGENDAPALTLKVKEDGKERSMLMTFYEASERTKIHSLLLGICPLEKEVKIPELGLQSYSIMQPADMVNGRAAVAPLQFSTGTVSVIDQERSYVEHGYGPTILSEHLRTFVAAEWGSVTDRFNLGPGELKLGLDVNKLTSLSLYRPAQQDLTVSVAENLIQPGLPDALTEFLRVLAVNPMVRQLEFSSLQDLHIFEAAVTGFKVLFDGVATSFIISRRRMVVPLHKRWETSMARVQVVKQDKVIQLIAFLSDFNHGTCMNFVVKDTDRLEPTGRGGKPGIRIVDAKFALPKVEKGVASDFVCLDMPEYPIEHDDITIAFNTESDRSDFLNAMPGSIKEPSRMASLRRR